MAQRRMFSRKITESDQFLDMPMSAQSLYFHINMQADDDGFVGNVKTIKRMIGASDDDLKLLIAKQFLIPFDTGIVVIRDWKIHNYIQKDRYTETFYKHEKAMLETTDNKQYQVMDTECIQDVSSLDTQVRLGKDRLGKDRLEIEKEIDSNNSQQSQKRYADDSQYMKVAVYLFEKIKERLPNKKEPDFQKWADEVRKTVELDGVPVERYKEVLDWSQNDDFWQANILSTNKLRKKFDTIFLQMQRNNKQKPQKDTFQNTRNSQEDTEITPEMMKAYEELKQNERT